MKIKTKILIAAIVAGVSVYAIKGVNPKTEQTNETAQLNKPMQTNESAGINRTVEMNETKQIINEVKAEQIALDVLKGGLVKASHIEVNNDGSKEFEVTILKDDRIYEVDIDASTGKILEITHSKLQSESVAATISIEEAKQIALNRVRGAVTEIHLDTYNNRLVYDIEISTTHRLEAGVIVDATTGEVLRYDEVD
ncbi:PepSY domain-containing protein [Bacillus sp. FJAT-29790]|uniref:PepSY domain-containing protein n=1 Tax=Bacillus sp. FJAT-29790 TaxID=1895002 RepID=UPI001C23574D|nr:PepSY domain-containing protein [Bacillus sp. FJAT-29790]MBU8878890.1 PepSY domain-containing protein [Bacillus sp. FJAT-29790]